MQATVFKGIVKATSNKFGPAFVLEGDDQWYNPDKKIMPSFEGVVPGATVEGTANGKWVHSVRVLSAGISGGERTLPSTPKAQSSSAPSDKDGQIARSVAVKLGFDNPIIADMVANKSSKEEAIQFGKDLTKTFERYLTTGSFDPKELA